MIRRGRGEDDCPSCGAKRGSFSQRTCPCIWSGGTYRTDDDEHEEPPEDGGEQAPADALGRFREIVSRPYRSEAQARAEREARS